MIVILYAYMVKSPSVEATAEGQYCLGTSTGSVPGKRGESLGNPGNLAMKNEGEPAI